MLQKTLAWLPIGLAATGLTSCSSIPGMKDPAVSIAPAAAFLQLRGDTAMQSVSGGQIVNNPAMDLQDDFGFSGHSDDFAIRAAVGDGFSGVQLDWLLYDRSNSSKGILTYDWGAMRAGDSVRTEVDINEIRFAYLGQLFDWEWPVRDRDLRVGLGLGASFVHRELNMAVVEDPDLLRTQAIHVEGAGTIYGIARGRVSWYGVSLNVDWGLAPDTHLGGEWSGPMQDLELLLSYHFENQNVSIFAGYRRTELKGTGAEGSLEYDIDFILDGFLAGFGVTF